MIKDLTKKITSSFLSCEKDAELLLKKLFVEDRRHGDVLKKLLIINTKDCLSENLEKAQKYQEKINGYSVARLIEEGYITFVPKLKILEHDEVKSYIVITFDNFSPTENPQYRDCSISFDIVCHLDHWDIGNYQTRPLKIAGYIDGILNNAKLTGIGTLQFFHGQELILNSSLSGYSISYQAVHGNDDKIPPLEV